MAVPPYSLDMDPIQDSVVQFFGTTFTNQETIVDAFLDSEDVPRFPGGGVKPFIVLWFRGIRRSGARRGTRSFGGPRMDSYNSGFDAVCVASNPSHARELMNYVTDEVVGRKFENTGLVTTDSALWEATRPILDAQNKPTRWAATQRFSYGVFQKRTAP